MILTNAQVLLLHCANKFGFILASNGLTLTRTIVRDRKSWIAGICKWPKTFPEPTDNGFDKRLVGMVLEDTNLDWCDDLKETWILGNGLTSNFVVFGR